MFKSDGDLVSDQFVQQEVKPGRRVENQAVRLKRHFGQATQVVLTLPQIGKDPLRGPADKIHVIKLRAELLYQHVQVEKGLAQQVEILRQTQPVIDGRFGQVDDGPADAQVGGGDKVIFGRDHSDVMLEAFDVDAVGRSPDLQQHLGDLVRLLVGKA